MHLKKTPPGRAPSSTRHRFAGRITGLHGDVLLGWALDRADLDERLVVEIHVDGACVELVRADQAELDAPDVPDVPGDGFHGFAVRLRPDWLQQAGTLAARIANTPHWLEGTLHLPVATPTATTLPAAARVWWTGGLQLTGWAWDPDEPRRHVGVSVREGSRVLARACADGWHPALVDQVAADHGFTLDLPWSLADGQAHELVVEDDRQQPLPGSPVVMLAVPGGLAGLVRAHWPGAQAQAARALALRVAGALDRQAPASAGFEAYPEWFALFQSGAMGAATREAGGLAGVLLYGEGTASDRRASLSSIAGQAGLQTRVEVALPDDVRPALRRLLASGVEAIVPLHVGDRLAPHALSTLRAAVTADDGTAWAFADCDRDGPAGERGDPWFKPSWDLDLFLGADLYRPGMVFGPAILQCALDALDGPDAPPAGIHALTGAIALATDAAGTRVTRIPRVLYHQRHAAAPCPSRAPACPQRLAAMQWVAGRLAAGARLEPHPAYPALLQAQWPLPADADLPRVSLVVPTRDQLRLLRTCIDGILSHTDYPDIELIVVDNQSADPATLDYLATLQASAGKVTVKVLAHPHPFNYARINNEAVAQASGAIVGLLNNDVAMRDPGWLRAMVAQLLRPGVGIVGAKLLWPNGMVQHGGVVVGINGLAAHAGNRWHADDAGYLGLNQLARRQSAVTAACLLVRKSNYEALGGLDAQAFPVTFNDVDFCLRAREAGLGVVWTPLAVLTHHESASRGKDHQRQQAARAQREQAALLRRWGQVQDPCYHPHLNHDWGSGPYAGLDLNPRA